MSSSRCTSVCKLAKNWCNTDVQVHEVKYVWTINNFNFQEAIGTNLKSPVFSAVTNPQVKWFLQVKPNGETNTKNTISLFLFLDSDSVPKKICAKFSACVLNQEQKEVCRTSTFIDVYSIVSEGETGVNNWGRSKFLDKNDNFRNNILVDQKLTIICTIYFSAASEAFPVNNVSHHCNVTPLHPEIPACNIFEKLGMFLENQELADIVLCVKGKEYPAHKLVLAAQSSVFAAMFKHNLKENETNRIEIEDMNEEVVAEMLRYMYTGKCNNSEKLADGLLAAADKYDLDRLKMLCAETLHKALSVDNALNILALADLHNIRKLKSEVIKFIVTRFAEVVISTAWENILVSNPKLIDEVCKALGGRTTVPNNRKNEDTSSESKRNRFE